MQSRRQLLGPWQSTAFKRGVESSMEQEPSIKAPTEFPNSVPSAARSSAPRLATISSSEIDGLRVYHVFRVPYYDLLI